MSNSNSFGEYIRDLRANVERGDSTEHTHRPALKALLEAVDPDIVATNEPRAHGADLVALHLLQSPKLDQFITEFPEKGTNEVDRVTFSCGTGILPVDHGRDAHATSGGTASTPSATTRVHINATQYFGGIPPEVWSFRVGGYQVCEKWLKDRKGRTLDYADIQHYQKIFVALRETIRLMPAIDQIIEAQSGWPGAFDAVAKPGNIATGARRNFSLA